MFALTTRPFNAGYKSTTAVSLVHRQTGQRTFTNLDIPGQHYCFLVKNDWGYSKSEASSALSALEKASRATVGVGLDSSSAPKTAAKRDLKAGEVLDGIGGFTCYGLLENSEACQAENLLPMGLSQGCCLKNDIPMDQVITYADVELPKGRLCDELWAEQTAYFAQAPAAVAQTAASSQMGAGSHDARMLHVITGAD